MTIFYVFFIEDVSMRALMGYFRKCRAYEILYSSFMLFICSLCDIKKGESHTSSCLLHLLEIPIDIITHPPHPDPCTLWMVEMPPYCSIYRHTNIALGLRAWLPRKHIRNDISNRVLASPTQPISSGENNAFILLNTPSHQYISSIDFSNHSLIYFLHTSLTPSNSLSSS